ncbi:MAG: M3 family oligoendopeptidase [Defluviitaleaceae bacterium]|nr:M3 family oligoendopeptidase [Defluviitaleaceae bacterium]
MTFHDFKYERPDFEGQKEKLALLIETFKAAIDADHQLDTFKKINKERAYVSTMQTLASIRHSIDTRDPFYDEENTYWDEAGPLYEELDNWFYDALLSSPFRDVLESQVGTQFFKLIECEKRAFSSDIIADLQEENRLASAYSKLLASAEIEFQGDIYTLPGLAKFAQDKDRSVREAALTARYAFFTEHEATLDDIYDQLIQVRSDIAKKLGFNNFTELGYVRMKRTDYNAIDVANFRKQVRDVIVPVASDIYEKQRARLGLDKLRYFDLLFEFESGNAMPKGDPDWILAQGTKMYSELSPETKAFFDVMVDQKLLDLVNKDGKQGGGYCTYINDYKVPFIFSNFNGTSGDIDVLTHEAGHAFQVYRSRHIEIPELAFPTFESCEIHSMSMEFFTWPWMELFFETDVEKYKYSHLASALTFIPYGVLVDEYQHFIYDNPTATKEARKAEWRRLEKQYLPHKDYEGCDYLARGGWWHGQSHIFLSPFYYIDYTLAQICALQFWKRMMNEDPTAWSDYLTLCDVGGSKSFLELIQLGNLKSPFEDGCVSSVITDIKTWLDMPRTLN